LINRDDANHLLLTPRAGCLGNVKGAEQSGAFILTLDIGEAGGYPQCIRETASELEKFFSKQCDIYLDRQRNRLTEGNKPYTKRIRFSQLSSFFNFVRNNIDPELRNPCDRPMIRKLYRERVPLRWKIIEKETVDEIIFRTTKVRNRLILELMARGGMRIGEVLKLRLGDLQDRKLVLREPKSGREYEFVFIPQKVADRLREYALQVCNAPGVIGYSRFPMKPPGSW
jgi:integrase